MVYYTTSLKLKKHLKYFLEIKYYSFIYYFIQKKGIFYGWGKKKSGFKAIQLAQKYKTSFILLEDGFIRSLGLGVEGSPSFSLVEDDVGIYYDATAPSKLENLLNHYDFQSDAELMANASRAIALIKEHHISKYNHAPHITNDFFKNKNEQRVLVIAQTAGDSSLEYGMLENFSTQEMIQSAIEENPNATVYIKIHPDVLSGKKASDIEITNIPKECIILDQDVNPLSLLKHFKKVYTKTSGMGFEALLVGCECICFGMPFYAGWGVTTDKSTSTRRQAKRSIEEVFAAAYILYTRYYNPYKKRECNIFEVIEEINLQRKKQQHTIK
jgi:capsular polysaccharide export protein